MLIRKRPRIANAQGFTLLELVVVVTVLSIMAAVAFPLFGGALSRQRAQGIVQEVVLTLRLAHQRSVFRQQQQDFVIDFRNSRCWIETLEPSGRSGRLRKTISEPRDLPDFFEFPYVYFSDLDDTERRRTSRISFYPDGTATDAVFVIAKEDPSGEFEYEYVEVIQIRGTDSKIMQLTDDDEDREWYVDLL